MHAGNGGPGIRQGGRTDEARGFRETGDALHTCGGPLSAPPAPRRAHNNLLKVVPPMTRERAARHLHAVARGILHERAGRRRIGEKEAQRLRERLGRPVPPNRLEHLVDEIRHQWRETEGGKRTDRGQLMALWTAVRQLYTLCGCQPDSRTLHIGEQLNSARAIEDLESRLAEAVENLRDRANEMVTLVAERETAIEKLEEVRRTDFDWTYTDVEPPHRTVRVRFDGDGPATAGAPHRGAVREGALHSEFFRRLSRAAMREAAEGERRRIAEEANGGESREGAEAGQGPERDSELAQESFGNTGDRST